MSESLALVQILVLATLEVVIVLEVVIEYLDPLQYFPYITASYYFCTKMQNTYYLK